MSRGTLVRVDVRRGIFFGDFTDGTDLSSVGGESWTTAGSDKGGGTSLVVLSFLSKGFIWVESLLLFGSLVGHGTEM